MIRIATLVALGALLVGGCHGRKAAAPQAEAEAKSEAGPVSLGEMKASFTTAPEPGFVSLLSGKDLTGWKGLVADPPKRAKMSAAELATAQVAADARMREHWRIETENGQGILHFDGKGDNLCTAKDYADFEMLVDWKILPGGDSGIYLRGSPQVQIWENAAGSGGLYNNQKHASVPIAVADRKPGEWNTFRIRMVGERVWVWLNGRQVVDGVVMENYWERNRPIYATGAIELQNHGGELWFRNIMIRELPADASTSADQIGSTPAKK